MSEPNAGVPDDVLNEALDPLLLMSCDSLLSLIRHREKSGLTEQTIREIDQLLPTLRSRISALSKGGRRDG